MRDAGRRGRRQHGPPALPGHALSAPDKLNIAREFSYVRADGTHVPVSLVVSAMSNEQGEVTGYVGVAHDISERLAQERTLRYAVHEADAANKAKTLDEGEQSYAVTGVNCRAETAAQEMSAAQRRFGKTGGMIFEFFNIASVNKICRMNLFYIIEFVARHRIEFHNIFHLIK